MDGQLGSKRTTCLPSVGRLGHRCSAEALVHIGDALRILMQAKLH